MALSRGRLSALTLTVLLLLLAVAAVVGWRALTSPLPGDQDEAAPACAQELQPGDVVATSDVTVSVYNAGNRSGLAGETLDAFTARGFIAGDAGNAPGELSEVEGALVLAPAANDPAARLVARQLGKGVEVRRSSEQLGPGVEVVVGDSFDGLVEAPRRLRARAAGSGC